MLQEKKKRKKKKDINRKENWAMAAKGMMYLPGLVRLYAFVVVTVAVTVMCGFVM